MSTDMTMDPTTPEPIEQDFTLPIARAGEQQFACILRNRSGFDAGEIDYSLRQVTTLCASDQQDVVDMAWALYEAVCRQTGKSSRFATTPEPG